MNHTELPTRKKIRLQDYDYSQSGFYYVTICTANRSQLFWKNPSCKIDEGTRPSLSEYGKIADVAINLIEKHYSNIKVKKYCIMPDHIHMIIFITDNEDVQGKRNKLNTVIGQMKRYVSKEIGKPIWQKSFYDEIIRNESGYLKAWQYIDRNPYMQEQDDVL